MIIVAVVVAVLALGAVAIWAMARFDVPGLREPVTTESATPLPLGLIGAGDVADVRFDQAIRGYRMGQVDRALSRLAQELADRDQEITRLRLGTSTADQPQGPDRLGEATVRHLQSQEGVDKTQQTGGQDR